VTLYPAVLPVGGLRGVWRAPDKAPGVHEPQRGSQRADAAANGKATRAVTRRIVEGRCTWVHGKPTEACACVGWEGHVSFEEETPTGLGLFDHVCECGAAW
jgi:hypothetical protein